jgi:hypothetical protein
MVGTGLTIKWFSILQGGNGGLLNSKLIYAIFKYFMRLFKYFARTLTHLRLLKPTLSDLNTLNRFEPLRITSKYLKIF